MKHMNAVNKSLAYMTTLRVVADRLAAIRMLREGGATFEEAKARYENHEQAIRDAVQDLSERDFVKAFTPNKHGEYQ